MESPKALQSSLAGSGLKLDPLLLRPFAAGLGLNCPTHGPGFGLVVSSYLILYCVISSSVGFRPLCSRRGDLGGVHAFQANELIEAPAQSPAGMRITQAFLDLEQLLS